MAASFRFRLEGVRALRQRSEELAREELARGLTHRQRGEALAREALAALDAARSASRGAASAPAAVSGADLLAAQAWLERAEHTRESAALELDRRDAEVEARRATLARAAREREVLERLKRRRQVDFEREQARRETLELDEIALAMHLRRVAA